MSTVNLPDCEYAEDLLDAAGSAKEQENLRQVEKLRIAGFTPEEAAMDPMAGWRNWMRGRHGARFNYFAICQAENHHEVAYVRDEVLVCTCGLITGLDEKHEENHSLLLSTPGHVDRRAPSERSSRKRIHSFK